MVECEVFSDLCLSDFSQFDVKTLVIESEVLKKNALGDSPRRKNPVLVPKGDSSSKGFPVVFVLAGFAGNGPKYFSLKSFEENGPEVLDRLASVGKAPKAIYVFVDAMTFWGGSQFINSKGTGLYEDYIVKELLPAVRKNFPVREGAKFCCVAGASSGGYGALHLASKHPKLFGVSAAIAPDCFFEASLFPELLKVVPMIKKMGGIKAVRRELKEGKLLSRKSGFDILNVIGMGSCYAPTRGGGIDIPMDQFGLLDKAVWRRWKDNDPVVFLKKRRKKVEQMHRIYLDVGDRDQFHLQYGARQIKEILGEMKVSLRYTEFSGTHWDISKRRPELWSWLNSVWPN